MSFGLEIEVINYDINITRRIVQRVMVLCYRLYCLEPYEYERGKFSQLDFGKLYLT